MSILSVFDILQIAMEIEQNGEKFYREISKKFKEKDKNISELYANLADEEVNHYNTFKKMLDNVKNTELSVNYEQLQDDYKKYLKSYTDNLIFTNKKLQDEAERISTISQALDQSIKRELDSILYYQEIKDLLFENKPDVINSIINEERKHFLKLSSLKERYK